MYNGLYYTEAPMYSTLSTQVNTRHKFSTRVSKDSVVQHQRPPNTHAWLQDLPRCQRRLYEEGSLDPTLSKHSQNKSKNEIFGISTWVHVMSKHTSAVQKSTMLSAEVSSRGITWPDRDHMTWLCHSTHETKRRTRYLKQNNIKCMCWDVTCTGIV